jgi:hypothetical protein
MAEENPLTQIAVRVKTRERLKERKLTKRESYDEVINRTMDENERLNAELERMKA